MPRFDWYFIFNHDEFIDSGLVSKEATLTLEGIGSKKILITKGVGVSVVYEDLILPVSLNDKNPYRYGERAVFKDADGDVWLGVYIAD